MSGQTLKFSELSKAADEELKDKPKKGIEIEIEVAGPKEPVTRTVKLALDNRGLIKLSFKEGGKMPEILAGRFTDIEAVKTSLTVWKHREDKQYKIDEEIKVPKQEGQNISEIVDEVIADSAPPGFDEKLDDALVDAKDEEVNSNDDIVILD